MVHALNTQLEKEIDIILCQYLDGLYTNEINCGKTMKCKGIKTQETHGPHRSPKKQFQ